MRVKHIEIFVEEQSAEVAVRQILTKLCPRLSFEIYSYQGKPHLLKNLPARLRGYKQFLPKDTRILVLLDNDDDDCKELKRQLEEDAVRAGLRVKSRVRSADFDIVIRLAMTELESWFFGDWQAVCSAFPRVDPHLPRKKKYRNPDAIPGKPAEALERILQRAGYFKTGVRKIELAKTIA